MVILHTLINEHYVKFTFEDRPTMQQISRAVKDTCQLENELRANPELMKEKDHAERDYHTSGAWRQPQG